jgi:hypothetical protein
LWSENGEGSDWLRFCLECLKSGGCEGFKLKEIKGWLLVVVHDVLAKEPDFQVQSGRLAEELEALNHRVILYPKFHCELNFISKSFFFYERDSGVTVSRAQLHKDLLSLAVHKCENLAN